MQEIWNNYVEHSFGEAKQAEFKFQQYEFNYKAHFPVEKDAPVLDIGPGRGEMLACMKKWGYAHYEGIDISSSTTVFCRSLGLNCQRTDSVVAWLKDRRAGFSCITLLDVLEHVKKEDTGTFLKALKEALKDDGILIIQVPNLQSPDGQLTRYYDFTHEVGYMEHSLKQVLLACGFKNIEFFGFEPFVFGGLKEYVMKFFRYFYWKFVKFVRLVSGHAKLEILHPVFYAVVKKERA
jgi:cyclopropane fatty-acyl-phospholipid synthase-like methyltransferase